MITTQEPVGPTPSLQTPPSRYVGRFAPSPSGLLHRGSIVAALASWLDARAHDGRWLVRIENIDPPRERAGAAIAILAQLAALGLDHDGEVWYQSQHLTGYEAAFEQLQSLGLVYACACTRRELALSAGSVDERAAATDDIAYPGTCRNGIAPGRTPRASRFRLDASEVVFDDRALGPQKQCPLRQGGDFVLRRADGYWAYQLAVVVDDAASGVTDVVRGADLLGSTGRQILLQRALGLPTPRYLHLPLVVDALGRKLSKHEGADPVGTDQPLFELERAARFLGLQTSGLPTDGPARWLRAAVTQWRDQFGPGASALGTLPPSSTASRADPFFTAPRVEPASAEALPEAPPG